MPDLPTPAIGSPEWWLRRLSTRLDVRVGLTPFQTMRLSAAARRGQPATAIEPIDLWQDYYKGRLNLALASEKWRAEFASRFPSYSANFMAIVVDTHRARLQVQGIRYGDDPKADTEAWDWWQDNHMDAESLKLHREMLVSGSAYALVWPNEQNVPEISIESPSDVIVATQPGKAWKRQAALKRFIGEDDRLHAELYLPDGIYRFRSQQTDSDFSMMQWYSLASWERDQRPGETWPIKNPFGVVPVVPFVHQPDLLNEGTSKIKPVASNQDAINKLRVDAFVSAEFASYRQRWAIGIDIPTDPVTGEAVEPFRAAVDRLWIVEPPDPAVYPDANNAPKVQFGEFDVTPLAPFYAAIDGELQMMAGISNTPQHRLLPQSGQPASADAIRSEEAGLIAEVLDSMVNIGEAHEEIFRLNFLMRDDPRGKQRGAEIIWRDPEVQSEGAHIDALVKMRALGVPDEALWQRMQGVTQSTIRQWRTLALQQQLEQGLTAPTILPNNGLTGPNGAPPAIGAGNGQPPA